MANAFVIVDGEYADYRIISVWTTRKAADEEVERFEKEEVGYDIRVVEFPVDTPHDSIYPPYYKNMRLPYYQ